MNTFCQSCPDCYVRWSPPVILRAVNRYYCSMAYAISHKQIAERQGMGWGIIDDIVAMVGRSGIITVAHPITGIPMPYEGVMGDEVYQGTKVEVYNYIQTVRCSRAEVTPEIRQTSQGITSPPRSLSLFQDVLEEALPAVWKGKVKLMDKEEAPLCPACGCDILEKKPYRMFHHSDQLLTYANRAYYSGGGETS